MSGNRIINLGAGAVYNEHVEKQIFFQGTVNVHTSDGSPGQEQYMKPVEAICAEREEPLEVDLASYPDSPLDANLFNEALDMAKVKQTLGTLVEGKRRRGELKIAHWFIVWKFFRQYCFIPMGQTQAKFIRWATAVFGWSWKSNDFKGSTVPKGVKEIPLGEWTMENLSAQRPQAEEYIRWRDALSEAFLTEDRKGRIECREGLCTRWFDTNMR